MPPVPQAESVVNQALIRACEEGQGKARLAYLLSKGADIEFRSEANCTPLHHAAFSGPVESVEFLLDAGADINAFHNEWKVPLCIAILRGRLEIVETLLGYKANVNIHCPQIGSPAHAMLLVLEQIRQLSSCCIAKALILRHKNMSTLGSGQYLCTESKDHCSVTPFSIALLERSPSLSVTAKL